MENIDMEKLEKSIVYLQRIADGKNPVNNLPAEEDSVLNNPNVIRCMFFVKDVLEQVKRNDGYIGKKSKGKNKLEFPVESVKTFSFREELSITKLVAQLNEGIDEYIYQKLGYKSITEWLRLNGYLFDEHNESFGKTITLPTQKGIQLGIRAERRSSSRGVDYMAVLYGKQAQEYIVQNLEKILNGEVE